MASENMHTMSLQQLDNLWKFDFRVCAALTGLPLRTCSAKPNNSLSVLFPAMKDDEFRQLKQGILKMWVRAACYFKFRNQDGKGVFCPSGDDNGYPSCGFLSPTKKTVMGWLAKAPEANQCPTAHRYQRSALESNLYLGGPVSLVNQDALGRISVHASTCKSAAKRHLVTVLSTRKMVPGSELLLWTYCRQNVNSNDLNLTPTTEWFLPECCSEVEIAVLDIEQLPGPTTAPPTASEPPMKRKKHVVGGIRPLTKSLELPRFCLCPYCGLNVDSEKSYSPNLKRHLSLHHAADVVKEIGKEALDMEDPATAREFTLQLDKIDNVLDGLHKRFINYQPACNFIRNCGQEAQLRDCERAEEEKERVFKLFIQESMHAYKRYQVVFLKGATFPVNYDDLLPCSESSHADIIWSGEKPSNTNFSINKLGLQEEEIKAHKLQVVMAFRNIIANYEIEDLEP
ncbi:Chaperone protein [Frankliniella fusca]|uniref:Chaperone protein n=1 Tax=Frankliniella fusca TaxID=407009 RepID=A0AAE1LEA7_9NEOP|nr:Chaperone protein [Frankliniella fusca]